MERRENHPSTERRRRHPSTERRESCTSTARRGRQPSTAMRRRGVPSTHGGRRVFDTVKNLKFRLRNPSGRREMMMRHQKNGKHEVSAKRGEHHQFILNELKVRQMCGYQGMTMKMYGTQRRDEIQMMKEHMYGSQSKLEHMYGFRRRRVRRPRRNHAVANLDLVRVRRTESPREKNECKKRVIEWHLPQSRAKLQRPRRLQRAMRGACHAVSHSIWKF